VLKKISKQRDVDRDRFVRLKQAWDKLHGLRAGDLAAHGVVRRRGRKSTHLVKPAGIEVYRHVNQWTLSGVIRLAFSHLGHHAGAEPGKARFRRMWQTPHQTPFALGPYPPLVSHAIFLVRSPHFRRTLPRHTLGKHRAVELLLPQPWLQHPPKFHCRNEFRRCFLARLRDAIFGCCFYLLARGPFGFE